MYHYDLKIAGVRLRIPANREICFPESFQPFLVPVEGTADITMEVSFGSSADLDREKNTVNRITQAPDGDDILRVQSNLASSAYQLWIPEKLADSVRRHGNWLLYMAMEQLLLPFHRLILHASAVIYQGKAFVFTAPSGTGKSTQAEIWCRELGAEVINGDKVILSVDNGVVHAYGSPVAGSSNIYKNIHAPVAAILLLRQAPRNTITRANNRSGYFALYSGLVKSPDDPEFNTALLPYIEKIITTVPVLTLSCTPDRGAAECVLEWMDTYSPDWCRKEETKCPPTDISSA